MDRHHHRHLTSAQGPGLFQHLAQQQGLPSAVQRQRARSQASPNQAPAERPQLWDIGTWSGCSDPQHERCPDPLRGLGALAVVSMHIAPSSKAPRNSFAWLFNTAVPPGGSLSPHSGPCCLAFSPRAASPLPIPSILFFIHRCLTSTQAAIATPGKATRASQRSAKAKGKEPDVAQPITVSHSHRAQPPPFPFLPFCPSYTAVSPPLKRLLQCPAK
jgi:hypothetical protein